MSLANIFFKLSAVGSYWYFEVVLVEVFYN